MRPSDGAIRGSVTGPASTALAGICLSAWPTTVGSQALCAVTTSTGSYSLLTDRPGDWILHGEFNSGCGATGYRTQWWNDKTTEARLISSR